MGDRRGKKISRVKRNSEFSSTEEMGRARHLESPTGSSRDSGAREQKRKHPSKERWLLTRKTWRYMADAGRRLIPDGAHNRPEDVPKIEAYFQQVCRKEPKFLLWRKCSYPGALGFRSHPRKNRNRKKGGSCREKASSADEAESLVPVKTGSGRFDLQRLKQEFLYGPSTSETEISKYQKSFPYQKRHLPNVPETSDASGKEYEDDELEEEDADAREERELLRTLSKYLNLQQPSSDSSQLTSEEREEALSRFDYQKLMDQLRRYLSKSNILDTPTEYQSGKDRQHDESSLLGRNLNIRTTTYRPLTPSPPPSREGFDFGTPERMTLDTLKRYYNKSTCRQKVITDLLTDRKMLEKMYFDLRKTRGFKSGRKGTGFTEALRSPNIESVSLRSVKDGGAISKARDLDVDGNETQYSSSKGRDRAQTKQLRPLSPLSPPPLIEIYDEADTMDAGTQTEAISAGMYIAIEEELKKSKESAGKESRLEVPERVGRRRSSVDNDDVSPSVSDTIKRYLRMARKKSLDADKVDRFKRVNYDRNIRNIKPKGEISMPGDDDGLNKGCQPDESWITALKALKIEDVCSDTDDVSGSRITSSRSSLDGGGISDDALLSPPAIHGGKQNPHPSSSGILSSGQTFLSNILHGLQHYTDGNTDVTQSSGSVAASAGGAMQKSKSSSSVMHHGSRLVAKKIWRARSKSQSRATASATSTWTPQGNCTWTNVTGRQVTLSDTNLLTLSEVERRVMQKVALAKLQALNLGVSIRIPSETVVSMSHKPKRRPYLIKRKALTTSFFDTSRGKDDKDKDNGGLVFGIPISQCLENDRLNRPQHGDSPSRDEPAELSRKSHHGSRTSCSSLIETSARGDERGSCESLMSPTRMAGSVPGLLDTLSCSSTLDITAATCGEREPSIPQLVQSCFRHLESFGLHTLGIFRVSSSKKRVRQLREHFDCGKEIALGEDHCPHDVATLLKEFFRDLPEPLLCRDLYQAFIQTQKIRNRRLQYEALQHLVQLLPVPNRDTLCALLNFLLNVARNSEDRKDESGEWLTGSKMDSTNLATVFAPNILHCIKPGSNKELSTERAEERIDVINVIRSMIDHNKDLFQVPAELLDEVYLHMMDTHPESLDQLLRKRGNIGDDLIDDLESSVTEGGGSETSSVPRTPTLSGEMLEPQVAVTYGESEEQTKSTRRVWSREEFLHETAGMGGPDVSMRPRHKDREHVGQHSSKKRWKEEPVPRKKADSVGGPETPKVAFGITTSASASQITFSSHQKSSALTQHQHAVAAAKSRSFSVDGSHNLSEDHTVTTIPQTIKLYNDHTENQDPRGQISPLQPESGSGGGVIKASLKIPVPSASTGTSLTFNLDDTDIPYIEDAGGGGGGTSSSETGRQQMTIGLVRRVASGDVRLRRQRSGSGSDSSQASTSVLPPCSISTQLGCDSAVGSSATFSSPPYNATPSICSSDAGLFSSPPSWASSPPMSPDALETGVTFRPEDLSSRIQQTARLSIATSAKGVSSSVQSASVAQKVVKETMPVILQKVTFTSTSELQQVQKSEAISERQETPKSGSQHKTMPTGELPKSASTTSVMSSLKKSIEPEPASDRKLTTSISSIGGAVMRSKTADIERMLRIKGEKGDSVKVKAQPTQTPVQEDKKKYSKRRYTDSRHQTRHIPDSEALHEGSATGGRVSDGTSASRQKKAQPSVWKRRELIASDPQDQEGAL